MSEQSEAAVDHKNPMYCPECHELVPEWWDKYDETFACPQCRSMTYESKEDYIEATHGVARWRRENGYEGGIDA
ncbi:hypothetical protein [Halorubrum tebenquichense]|nr:hypothetical protein [Halorubrum tebenquichense]